jgi:chromosomal replication initiation ATPase DnaA
MKKTIFENYAYAIAEQFHLTLDEMFTKTKKRDVVDARQMLWWLCVERPIRISYVRTFMKERGYEVSHSTIIHGYKQAKKLIDTDPDYENLIKVIQEND